MEDNRTAPIDTSVVLRRAIELEQSRATDLPEILDDRTLAEVAAEIGVSPDALAEALADERAGVPSDSSIVDRLVGPRWVWSNRTVPAADDEARERLLEWLSVTHGLRPRVRPDGVIVASKRRDLAGKIGTGLRRVQGLGGLGAAKQVQAAAVQSAPEPVPDAEDQSSSMSLAADVGPQRTEAIVGGSATAIGLSAVIGLASVVTGPVILVGLPVAAGVGTMVARRVHRTTVVRMTESVEATVDGVAKGETPRGPLGPIRGRRRSD